MRIISIILIGLLLLCGCQAKTEENSPIELTQINEVEAPGETVILEQVPSNRISADLCIDIGCNAPAMDLILNDDSVVAMQKYEGTPTLIYLHASWCPPCIQVTSMIAELSVVHPETDFLLVNLDESAEVAMKYIDEKYLGVENAHGEVFIEGDITLASEFLFFGIPDVVIIDSAGVIVYKHTGIPDEEQIDKLLSSLETE